MYCEVVERFLHERRLPISGIKSNPVRTLADSIASEYLEAELDAVPFQGVESEPSASPFDAPPRTMTD